MPHTDEEREYWNAQKHGSRDDETPREERTESDQPAEERGERLDTGKTIARGGKSKGKVPGTTDQSK